MSDLFVFIQARLSSSRLPGKVLYPFRGKPLIIYLLNSLSHKIFHQNIIVLASGNDVDTALEFVVNQAGYKCLRYDIDEDDVLNRFLLATRQVNAKHIVRLTADNPLYDVSFLEEAVEHYVSSGKQLASTRTIHNQIIKRYAPKGLSIDIFSASLLEKVAPLAKDPYDREHVIPKMFEVTECQILKYPSYDPLNDTQTLSIDTAKDYLRIIDLSYYK